MVIFVAMKHVLRYIHIDAIFCMPHFIGPINVCINFSSISKRDDFC